MYWAILHKAGFEANEGRLKRIGLTGGSKYSPSNFDPHFNKDIIQTVFGENEYSPPDSLAALQSHLEAIEDFRQRNPKSKIFQSGNDGSIFGSDENALLAFLSPNVGSGPAMLRQYRKYHSPQADDFIKKTLEYLDIGKTVILDLGSAEDEIRRYFSDLLSREVFTHQEKKFTSDTLGNHFVQLYFEEAHNLFPVNDRDLTGVYARFAKEGAKFHIGIVYSTQSPTAINAELLTQTENFFVAHISSRKEVDALAQLQDRFDGLQHDILTTRTPGYMRMLTYSNRFVIPVQIHKFEEVAHHRTKN
jgi:hypothetical protein